MAVLGGGGGPHDRVPLHECHLGRTPLRRVGFRDDERGPAHALRWVLPILLICRMYLSTTTIHQQFAVIEEVALGGVPRERKMLVGHLLRVIYHQLY